VTSLEAFKVYLNVHFAVSDALLKKKIRIQKISSQLSLDKEVYKS
jgi:hypothetical protein